MDLLGMGKSQLSQTSSRVAPVHGAQETDITLKRSGVLWNTRTYTGIKISVVIILLPSLLLWTARLRHGLSLPAAARRLRCVVRSSVPCTSLKSSSSRIKRMLGMHLCLRQWTLSRSRPVRSLIRLKSLIYRPRSVFGVLLGAMSITPSRSLMVFTWSQGPLVDSKLSSP
jgi:hypothetical protein